ncbi:MAG: DUF5343 domain-containing protein [Dehalococcoidales bacterium]|nr:DUF5343 domain-containing protein [Dehalococcoidales bacterium]
MVFDEKIKRRLPPYVSYHTFKTFVDGLRPIPSRFDHSFWGKRFSGTTRSQLTAAMLFLGLINIEGVPTNRLKLLADAKDVKKSDLLKQTCTEAFDFLFNGSFDSQTATPAQLQQVFHNNFQISNSVSRKCIKFFVDMANDAGISLSPFITKQYRAYSNPASKTSIKKSSSKPARNTLVPQSMDEIPDRRSWDTLLLNKFPQFDPSWPDEVKLKWFSAFDELMRRGLTKT